MPALSSRRSSRITSTTVLTRSLVFVGQTTRHFLPDTERQQRDRDQHDGRKGQEYASAQTHRLVDCINWKSTAHNEPRPRFPGRDNRAAGSEIGKDVPLDYPLTAMKSSALAPHARRLRRGCADSAAGRAASATDTGCVRRADGTFQGGLDGVQARSEGGDGIQVPARQGGWTALLMDGHGGRALRAAQRAGGGAEGLRRNLRQAGQPRRAPTEITWRPSPAFTGGTGRIAPTARSSSGSCRPDTTPSRWSSAGSRTSSGSRSRQSRGRVLLL